MADHQAGGGSGGSREVLSLSSGTTPVDHDRRSSRRLKKSGSFLHFATAFASSHRFNKSEDDLQRAASSTTSSSSFPSFKSSSGRDIIVVSDRSRKLVCDDDDEDEDEEGLAGEVTNSGEHAATKGSIGKMKLVDSIRIRRPRRKERSLSSLSSSMSRCSASSSSHPSSPISSTSSIHHHHHCATRECCIPGGGDDCCSSGLYIDGTYANETLPYEVLLHIFGHLSMKELGVVCVVCRFWKEASEADCLWKSITLSLWGGLGLRDVQRAAATSTSTSTSSTSTTAKDTGTRSSSVGSTTSSSSSSSCPSSPSSSSALRPASSPFSSPKPSRRRGLLGLLGGSGSSFHTSGGSGGDELGGGGSGEAQATPDKGAKSRSNSVELQHHNSGSGASAEAQAQADSAAAASASDYLSSFSTLKDLYRHEFERRQRRGEDEYRIVVVGASGVDKSAICVRFVQGSLMLSKYDPTAEESYRVRRKVDGLPCMYDIMDTAGQMEYSALRDQYLKSGHGFLLVYSVTSPASFQALEKLRLQILRIKEDSTVPIVFLGSHADRESQRQVSQDEALFLAEKLNCGWLECSAKTGQNVNDAFELIVRMINRWRALHPAWNTPKSRQEATIKNRVKKKILFWRESNRT